MHIDNITHNMYLNSTNCNYRLKFKDEMNKRAELEEAMQQYVSYKFGCVHVHVLVYFGVNRLF